MTKVKRIRRDGAVEVSDDGTRTNSRLHEELTEGVDDAEFVASTRAILLAAGMSAEDLDGLLPIGPAIHGSPSC